MSDSQDSTDAFVRGLQQLRPERTSLDSRETFFQAGFEACRAQMEPHPSGRFAFSMAAVAALLLASVSASYHVGKTAGVSQVEERIAQQAVPESQPTDGMTEPIEDKRNGPIEMRSPTESNEQDEAEAPKSKSIELAQVRPASGVRSRSWLDPLADIARSTWLDRQTDSVLSTSHASLFARQGEMRNLSDFPFAEARTNRTPPSSGENREVQPPQDAPHPLAAGDFHVFAIGQEATR